MWSAVAFIATLGLQGCSSGPSGGGVKSDLLTDSDEPEIRKRARIRLELAVGYYNNGQTKIALDELKQSISADPSMFEAYNLRGLIYMRLDDQALAEESFRKALAINPKAATVQHNYGWMLCQQSRFAEAQQYFGNALANPAYGDRAKTWMTQGLCQLKNNQRVEAEASLLRSYELDAGNPITGYNLALMMYDRKEFVRAQFHVRRINNSELANAESLWLGIKVERQMENRDAMAQLGGQLKKRYPQSREFSAYERGAFDE
jgi:type IV pilus assembly protein PilF